MTAMLHCLIGDIAAELRASLPTGWVGANDDDAAIVEALTAAGLLDEPALMSLLLRRADEERIGTAARARTGRREARVLQGLVSHESAPISAAAMALILAKGRRRDRFGQCLVGFDDLPSDTADRLVHAIAAALRAHLAAAHGRAAADSEISTAAAGFVRSHDSARSIEALTAALVELLDGAGQLTDELLLACAQDGEIGFLAEAVGRRGGIRNSLAFDELLAANAKRVMVLLRIAGFSRDLCAGVLASLGDLLGIADPGAAIGTFDQMTPDEVQVAAIWLSTSPHYRSALEALGTRNG